MKKVMMLTTTAYMSERFNKDNILILESMGYEVHVVANFDRGNPISTDMLDAFKTWIEEHHGKWISIPITRNPADLPGFWRSYRETVRLIREHHYEFIHCHTPMGGVLGRVIAHRTHTRVIYTAHGFHFYTGAPLLNWLMYYPAEKLLSHWTDRLITINHEDYGRACRKFHAKTTDYVPGVGVSVERYRSNPDRADLCGELGLPEDAYLILSVGELNSNKNHATVIRALSSLKKKQEAQASNVHYLICGVGVLEAELKQLIVREGLSEQVHLLGFRKDIPTLCRQVDAFVFPSKREGLSVALMEAVAAELPVIASGARGNTELVEHGKNGIICKNNTMEEYEDALIQIRLMDKAQIVQTSHSIIEKFSDVIVRENMTELYRKMSQKTILVNYTGKKGGGVLDAYEMTKAFCDRGESVVAVVSEQISNLDEWKTLPLEKLVCIPTYDSMKSLAVNTLLFPLRQRRVIRRQLREFAITQVYCPMDTLWSGMINACVPKAKVTLALHDPTMHSGGNRMEAWLFARHNRHADMIIVHTRKFVEDVAKRYHKHVEYVPLGRHNIYRRCANKRQLITYDASKINFLFFGRITEYKGLDTLGEAYRIVSQKLGARVTLSIVGNGDFAPYEEAYASLPQTTKMVQWIADEEVESVFTGENLICVCPYKDATQSGVVLVALDYGVPCIVTRTGGLDEQIIEGETGLIVEPQNAAALADAMFTLAENRQLYQKMSQRALEEIAQMTWEVSAATLLAKMKEL